MPRDAVDVMLVGRVIPNPKVERQISDKLKHLIDAFRAEWDTTLQIAIFLPDPPSHDTRAVPRERPFASRWLV